MISEKIDLWLGHTYKGEMGDSFRPTMTTYLKSGSESKGLVVIFPGGGYGFTSPREAAHVAARYNQAGYHAVHVDYSVAPRRHPLPLLDAARVLTIIKENADKWQVDMDRIFVCGFSAGGHLCASISNFYKQPSLNEVDGIDLEGLKIRASILCYPVILYGQHMHRGSFMNLLGDNLPEEEYEALSLEKCVHEETPPTFLWHTFADQAVPVENTMMYAGALRENKVPFELHIYPEGGHGLSLATEAVARNPQDVNRHVASWMDACIDWMGLI